MIYAIVGTFELGFMIHSQMPATKHDEIFKLSINKHLHRAIWCKFTHFQLMLHCRWRGEVLPHHKWYLLPGNKEPHRAGKIIISFDNTMNIIVAIYIFWIMRVIYLLLFVHQGPPADTTAAASGRERRGNYDVRWDSQGSTNYRYLVVLCQRMIICIRSAKHFQLLLFVF